ncbi:acyl-CoA dehydrogenase [Sabulicella glaciei]|uniref:Acyl-CoA dehydrogenase family protein n=1 Tax=Sabulicella glaciei TaxID=2984948 RepID=A0ABT3NQJ3_9PROT|nr:acyl-CoA dehydrogenase [Roseococcus sp. MDT2-1-1]MCW8084440.1 acyl-CoA dehydrogenase family protein [Roseococcus sp. MDT2-1-1]
MSEMRALLVEQLDRLLTEQGGVAILREVEGGTWPGALWAEVEGQGLALALVPEEAGGAGLGWGDAAALWHVLGRHAAPVPLGEAMLAGAFLGAAGVELPAGFTALAPAGEAAPFGRHASALALVDGTRVSLRAPGGATEGQNTGREPRDDVTPGSVTAEGDLPNGFGPRPARLGLALLRAAQIGGALEKVLALTVDWANTRKQFGRPIGKFQAIQQSLAAMAAEVASVQVAVAAAARAAEARGLDGAAFEIACAKVVAGEAATFGAATAHQVFAAIGITEEHELHHLTRRLWSWREEGGTERGWAQEIGRAAMARGGDALWPDLTARDISGVPA